MEPGRGGPGSGAGPAITGGQRPELRCFGQLYDHLARRYCRTASDHAPV